MVFISVLVGLFDTFFINAYKQLIVRKLKMKGSLKKSCFCPIANRNSQKATNNDLQNDYCRSELIQNGSGLLAYHRSESGVIAHFH